MQNSVEEYNFQTQRIFQDVQAYGEFMIRYQDVALRDRIQQAVYQKAVREWYYEEYCYAVHYTSEQDICYQAVSQFLNEVNWEVVEE